MARLTTCVPALLLLGVLAGCPKPQPALQVAEQTPVAAPMASATPAPANPPPALTHAPATGAKHKADSDDLGAAYTANKPQGQTEYEQEREQELRGLRPKKVEKLVGTKIDVRFTGAEVSAQKDAKLCDLSFELQDREDRRATIEMTDGQREVAGVLNLGWCSIKVKPQISQGDVVPIGSGKVMNRVQRLGHYEIAVLDAKGKLIGNAMLNRDRTLSQGTPVKGYLCWLRRDREREDLGLLTIARVKSDESTEQLLMLRWSDSGFEHQSVTDKTGNIYEYAYPNGTLEVIPAQK